jgi:hypothetical protein
LFLLPLLTGAFLFFICSFTVLYRWEYSGGGGYTFFGIFYFFGFLISFIGVSNSSDRKFRGLHNWVESWGIDRWHIVIGIVLATLVVVGIFRIYCGEKDEPLGE